MWLIWSIPECSKRPPEDNVKIPSNQSLHSHLFIEFQKTENKATFKTTENVHVHEILIPSFKMFQASWKQTQTTVKAHNAS